VGAAGAAAAPIAGRVADGRHAYAAAGAAIFLGICGMLVAASGGHHIVVLALSAVLLDLAVQGHQVLSQREIYALRADARARINTVYMSTVFIGGAICSAVSGLLYERSGWIAVSIFGAALPSIALGIWAYGRVATRRPATVAA
jgi:predicted MFS family arabinose efflux permease